MKIKNMKISFSFETNRLSDHYMSGTYEKLFPMVKRKINCNKRTKKNFKNNNHLKQLGGN